MRFKSADSCLAFPSFLTGHAATLLALQSQYEKSQWWSPEQIILAQFEQLTILAEHAFRTVPFQAERLASAGFRSGVAMTPEIWRRLPVLTRAEVRDLGEKLHASHYPPAFGGTLTVSSGGSTGIPVRVRKTKFDALLWYAAHLREFDWNGVDFSLEIANLRGNATFLEEMRIHPQSFEDSGGVIAPDWGFPASLLWKTGRMGLMTPTKPQEEQAAYLIKRQPSYLIMRPAGLRLLLCHFRKEELSLDSIESVWTMSESVDESLRELCSEIFGCPIYSNYSSNETGYIALQCPLGTNYHAVSESQFVEVIDASGHPCKPGEIGRVVVTPLHNFAMPLLRYEVGDEAEVGARCSCGRGLISLTRIVGRLEDYVTLRSGVKRRVDMEHYKISAIRAVREFQLVQTSLDQVELRLVVSKPLDDEEMGKINDVLKKSYAGYLGWAVVIVESLPRSPAGKLMQFRSEI